MLIIYKSIVLALVSVKVWLFIDCYVREVQGWKLSMFKQERTNWLTRRLLIFDRREVEYSLNEADA